MEIPALRFSALRRPRILGRIASRIDELSPLTLLHAPAGFGKTTAVVQWAEELTGSGSADVHWVRAPDPSLDPRLIWHRIRESLGASAGNVHRRPVARVREEIDRILGRLSRPTVLVVDDYQQVTSGELDLALARLLERSDLLHLIVLSRRFTALDGPLVSSRVTVSLISGEELALTAGEARELAELYGATDHDRVERMRLRAHGWPLVVRSVLQEYADGRGIRDIARTLARFGRQHLDAVTTPGGRRAALAIVLCPDISTEMIADLIEEEHEDAELVVRELGELGIVQQSWWFDTTRYRCHEGLAGSLETLALQEFGDEAQAIRLRHAVDLSRDNPVEAVRQLFDIEEYGSASRVFTRYFLELTLPESGVLRQLRQIPDGILRTHPVLVGATLLMETPEIDTPHERVEQLYRWLRAAMRNQLVEGDQEQSAAAIALLAVAERMRGDGAEALRLARDIEARAARVPENRLVTFRFTMPLLYAALGLVGIVVGDLAMAGRNYRKTLETAERFANVPEQVRGWNGLAVTSALAGDLIAAEQHIDRGDALREQSGVQGPQLSWTGETLARALIASERQEVETARHLLDGIRGFLDRIEFWPLIVIAEATVCRLADGPHAALELVDRRRREARGVFPATLYLRCLLATHGIRLHTALGNYAEAERQLEALPSAHPDVAVAWGMLRLFTGDASESLARAEEASRRELTPRQRAENGLVAAAASWELGDLEGALARFAEAGELMESLGQRLLLGSVPFARLEALARAARESGTIDLVERVESLPEPLRVEAFESLTRAELRTLEALVTGLTLPKIARALFVTENTVKFHLKGIYRKLRVSGRAEAVDRATRMRLVKEPGQER